MSPNISPHQAGLFFTQIFGVEWQCYVARSNRKLDSELRLCSDFSHIAFFSFKRRVPLDR
jgi:hypothetical protein